MLKFKSNTDDRKALAKRVGELVGANPVYTRAPFYSYVIGDYTVDRAGNLVVPVDKADPDLLTILLTEGVIRMPEEGEFDETEEAVEEVVEEVTEEEQEDAAEADTAVEEAEPEVHQEPAVVVVTPVVQEPAPEETDAVVEEAEETVEEPAEEITPEPEANEPVEQEQTAPLDVNMKFPLTGHTGVSLRNLVHLFYSRGEVVSKSTGGSFRVDKELVEHLADDTCTYAPANFWKALKAYEEAHGSSGMDGLVIDENGIQFTGFAPTDDSDTLMAYAHLASAMNYMAINQKRIQAKEMANENEKYAYRIWLIRLGMNGDEYKKTRKILMKNLEGHTAFRTKEEADRAKEKAKRKREADKASRVARQEAAQTAWESVQPQPENATQPDTLGDSEGVAEDDAIPMF